MAHTNETAMTWGVRLMPACILAMGCVADLAINAAVPSPQAERFLPEICGLTVGMLTVLTFAMRRQAYLAAGMVFILAEMALVTFALPIGMRAGLCVASLATAAGCFAIFLRGPWMAMHAAPPHREGRRP